MKTMRAVLKGGKVLLEETSISPQKEELVIKVICCGICGTDLLKYRNSADTEEWGHELLGTIVGENQLVTVRTSYPCGECSMCLSGKHERCDNWIRSDFTGFSEYICVNKENVIPLNCSADEMEYVLTEPLNVAIKMLDKGNVDSKNSVAVIGNAAIGLMAAFVAKKRGCKKVCVFTRNHSVVRSRFCEKNDIMIFSMAEMAEQLADYDKIINTAPYGLTADVVEKASKHTDIVINGIDSRKEVLLDFAKIHFNNLSVRGCFPHPQNCFEDAVDYIKKYKHELGELITQKIPLDKIGQAFELASDGSKEYIKMVITMNKDELSGCNKCD